MIKAISQKGSNVYQNFKVIKVVPQTGPEYNGQEYVIVDFKYQLLTGAGFEVDRRGVAAITSQGPAIEALWAASTTARYVVRANYSKRYFDDLERAHSFAFNLPLLS